MQSKKIAIGGILSGTVVAGLGVVVLLGGLAEAEQPDRDPVPGYEGVDTDRSDVQPLPRPRSSTPSEKPSSKASPGASPEAVDMHEGRPYAPVEPTAQPTDEPDRPARPPATSEPTKSGGSKPTAGPTRTAEPEPSEEPSETSEPTTEPEPTETSTPTEETQPIVEVD